VGPEEALRASQEVFVGLPMLTIETGPKSRRPLKTRTFSVLLLGHLVADSLWEPGGDGTAERPVWADARRLDDPAADRRPEISLASMAEYYASRGARPLSG
jgi:hypothetical protein